MNEKSCETYHENVKKMRKCGKDETKFTSIHNELHSVCRMCLADV